MKEKYRQLLGAFFMGVLLPQLLRDTRVLLADAWQVVVREEQKRKGERDA